MEQKKGEDFFDKIVSDSAAHKEINQTIVDIFSVLADLQSEFKNEVHINLEKSPSLQDFKLSENVSVKDFENIQHYSSEKDKKVESNGGDIEQFFNNLNSYVGKDVGKISAVGSTAKNIAEDINREIKKLHEHMKS